MIEDFLENIISKNWIGSKSESNFSIKPCEIKDILLEKNEENKVVYIGKTEDYYFILDGIIEDGFKYGLLFLNTDLKNLLLGYKDRVIFNIGIDIDIERFANSLQLNYRLNKELLLKSNGIKNKRIKI